MTANVGNIDRAIRAVLGLVLMVLAFATLAGAGKIIALIVGVVLVATAGMKFCPAYRLLGINTCSL